ncbi:hypothetical protein HC928_15680 [bacterium]|nr:hypothetical protein [bacterium]
MRKVRVNVSHVTVRRLLKQQKYSLQSNRKEQSESSVERDLQFRYIERVKRLFIQAGHPVISVDAKKKELIGNFNNPGQSWKHEPERVDAHNFPSDAIAKATPYGIYDVIHNLGYVYTLHGLRLSFFAEVRALWSSTLTSTKKLKF